MGRRGRGVVQLEPALVAPRPDDDEDAERHRRDLPVEAHRDWRETFDLAQRSEPVPCEVRHERDVLDDVEREDAS